jgi:hypothetical protein
VNDDSTPLSTTKCPWCAEEILVEARKCKHCGEYLTNEVREPLSPENVSEGTAATPAPTPHQLPPPSDDLSLRPKKAPTCAVKRCLEPRELNSPFCSEHGANWNKSSKKTRSPVVPRASSKIICPHCQTVGSVKSRRVKVKAGISGGKATAAVMTMGVSVLASGLSRKDKRTEMSCSTCKMKWLV